MCDLKVGDVVKLDKSTKPYTYRSEFTGKVEEKTPSVEEENYTIESIDGDCAIIEGKRYIEKILLKHLIPMKNNINNKQDDTIKFDMAELRLSIFNSNKSKSLEEMKAIEEWILGN